MASARRSAPRRRKPARALAPVDASGGGNQQAAREAGLAPETGLAAPLELVFADAERRAVRAAVDLRGFRVSDQWLARAQALLPAAAAVRAFALDDAARSVSARGLRHFLDAATRGGALRSLRLAGCPGLDAHAVALDVVPTALVELDVSACEWVDDQFARAVARRCPALTTVALARCRRLTDYGVAAFAEPPAGAARGAAPRRLDSLDISFCSKVSDSGVLALLVAVATAGLRLRELRAAGLPLVEGLGLLGLPRFGSGGACLETLSLAALSNLRASAFAALSAAGALASIREVDLSSCAMVDDEALQALCIRPGGRAGGGGGCVRLASLKLAFCSSISDAGVLLLVGAANGSSDVPSRPATGGGSARRRASSHSQLQRLDLAGCFRLTDNSVVALAEACPELQSLVLDGVRRVGAKGVHALARHCPKLRALRWSGILVRGSGAGRLDAAVSGSGDFFSIPQVSAAAIAALGLAAQLETLRIGSTQCDVDALAAHLRLSSGLGPRLVDLDVSGIVTDALCLAIGASCANLRTLRLSRSRYFSEASFLRVPAGCRRLEALDLESCEQIRDAGLVAVAAGCPALERLSLANDWQVSDAGVAAVGEACASLQVLNVRNCPEVSLSALRAIAARPGNNLLVASADGLARKHPNVVAFLRRDNARRAAARRITRWLRPRTTAARRTAKSALAVALAWVRYRRRSAVRIQRSVRRFLGLQRHRALLLDARRARAATLAANLRLLRALVSLSVLLRSFARRWLVERQRRAFQRAEAAQLARHEAAMSIQRRVRGRLARRRAAAAREARGLERARRAAAAVDVQRAYRGFKSRERTLETRARLGRAMRAAMAADEACFALAGQLQRLARGLMGRRLARRAAEELAQRSALREASARRIQRAFRAFVARVALRNLLFRGAAALQRLWRGFVGRRFARGVVLARSYARPPFILMLPGGRGSIFTRALAVAWKRKRDAALAIAENLQRLYRGAVGRTLSRVALAAAHQRVHVLDTAARVLQHFFRGLVILSRLAAFRRHLRRRRRSATRIQAAWRMWQAKALAFARRLRGDRRRKLAALLRAMTGSEGAAADWDAGRDRRARRRGRHRSLLDEAIARQRRELERQQIRALVDRSRPREAPPAASLRLLQLGAVHALVRFYRARLALRGWQSPSRLRLLDTSAARIQALVRGRQTRRAVRALRRALEAAARLVQSAWRGRVGRKAWRRLIEDRAGRQRERDERDRASRVALKRAGQLALEALARDTRAAVALQRWYRTLRGRQVFLERREARLRELERGAAARLADVLRARVDESVVFQARVWRACVDERTALLELEEAQVEAMECELRELQRECRNAHVGAARAAADAAFLARRKAGADRTRAARVRAVETLKQRIQPFSAQAQQLTLESARVLADNRQLQRDLRVLDASVEAFQTQLRIALPMEPLLLPADVERLLALLPDDDADYQ